MGWTVGPEVTVPLPHSAGFFMRIGDDLRKSVVFFGYADPSTPTGATLIGTGFLLIYKHAPYLVTAAHLSHQLGSDPFILRVNRKDGTAENLHADGVKWSEHPDPAVDVALVELGIPASAAYDVVYFDGEVMLVTNDMIKEEQRFKMTLKTQ